MTNTTDTLPSQALVFAAANRAIETLASQASLTESMRFFPTSMAEMVEALIATGDAFTSDSSVVIDKVNQGIFYFINTEYAKHFLLLFRDVQVEIQRAELLALEKRLALPALEQLFTESEKTLKEALEEWQNAVGKRHKSLHNNERRQNEQLREWDRQRSPWPAYRNQFLEIQQQTKDLAKEYEGLRRDSGQFGRIRKLLKGSLENLATTYERSNNRATEISDYLQHGIENDGQAMRPGKIAAYLEDHLLGSPANSLFTALNEQLKVLVGALRPATRVTIGSDNGQLTYKEINFQRSTDQWLSTEVLSSLYELKELAEQEEANLQVALTNVRNRSLLLASEQGAPPYDPEELFAPIQDFLDKSPEHQGAFLALHKEIANKIEANLHLTTVYREEESFLPLPMQRGLSKFTRQQGQYFTRVREWLGSHIAGLEQLRGDAVREDRLSIAEKTVRVIRQRKGSEENAAYTSILTTKGYVGESFLVGRDDEAEQVNAVIKNWRLGYRGAVILSGQRLAGKTLFGELVANRFFTSTTIRLRPNTSTTVFGRRLKTTGNLGEALDFIEKYALQSRPMIWIDDLETWWDKDITLGANVRELADHIDNNSGRIFYLVATTRAVYEHLNHFMDLAPVFQADINLDYFSLEEMQQALIVRHGATHKTLVDKDGEPMSESAFTKRVRRLFRAANGNVGDTLNMWAYLTEKYDEDSVTPSKSWRYSLPQFLTPEMATVLSTIFLEKRTNEYQLRQLFGPSFSTTYRSVLKRLLSIGILKRDNNGWLEISEPIVNDLGRLLEQEAYLTKVK